MAATPPPRFPTRSLRSTTNLAGSRVLEEPSGMSHVSVIAQDLFLEDNSGFQVYRSSHWIGPSWWFWLVLLSHCRWIFGDEWQEARRERHISWWLYRKWRPTYVVHGGGKLDGPEPQLQKVSPPAELWFFWQLWRHQRCRGCWRFATWFGQYFYCPAAFYMFCAAFAFSSQKDKNLRAPRFSGSTWLSLIWSTQREIRMLTSHLPKNMETQ